MPREQTFKQAGALCPSVSRAVTDPSTSWRQPSTSMCLCTQQGRHSPGLGVNSGLFGKERGYLLSICCFPMPQGSLPPPCRSSAATSRDPGAVLGAHLHVLNGSPGSLGIVRLPASPADPGHTAALDHSSALISLIIALSSGICPLSTTLSSSHQCGSSVVNNKGLA